jgi:hypothetical protein
MAANLAVSRAWSDATWTGHISRSDIEVQSITSDNGADYTRQVTDFESLDESNRDGEPERPSQLERIATRER